MPVYSPMWEEWKYYSGRALLPALLLFFCWSPIIFGPEQTHRITDQLPRFSFDKPVPPRSAYDPTKVALLIEGRPMPHLAPIMLHFISVVPPEWRFKFFGTAESVAHINKSVAIRNQINDGKLDIDLLPSHLSLAGQEATSQTFTTLSFYRDTLAPAEYLLVFQTDSMICANSLKTVNDYIEWDWVGAAWSTDMEWGGNGGLSIRRVSKIIRLLEQQQRPVSDQPEDVWLSSRLFELPHSHMANGMIQNEFSSENIYHFHPLGYHTGAGGETLPGGVWGTPEKRKEIWDYCPEMKMWLNMDIQESFNTTMCEKNTFW